MTGPAREFLYLLRQLFYPLSGTVRVAACGARLPLQLSGGSLRVINRSLGFALDVPASWDLAVEQRYDGPLRLFGFTLLPRILRPGAPRAYRAEQQANWNCLTLRGGPAVGLDISAGCQGPLPTLSSVTEDKWARLLSLRVSQVEEGVAINGLTGFAVVRNLPAGCDLTGFGTIAEPVVMRQWWLQGGGLNLEIRGVAPRDCRTVQDEMDAVVASIAATD